LLPGSLSDFPVFVHPGMSRWNDYRSACANDKAGMVKNGKSTPANCVIQPSRSSTGKLQMEKWVVQWETIYTLTVGGQFRLFPDLHFSRVGNLCSLDRMMGTFNMLEVAKL